jgi:bifunctional enzyme CysN/CysC
MVTPGVVWQDTSIARAQRWDRLGCRGGTVWFTGLSGSGKSTVADAVAQQLQALGRAWYILDGDNLRHGLNGDLGFSAADRSENVRRVGEVARLMADAGVVVLVPLISPYRADRDRARAVHQQAGLAFCEVYLDVPLEVCEGRDVKGLYAQARAGAITGFTGIDDPYEAPEHPDLRLVAQHSIPEQAAAVMQWISEALPVNPAASTSSTPGLDHS